MYKSHRQYLKKNVSKKNRLTFKHKFCKNLYKSKNVIKKKNSQVKIFLILHILRKTNV